MTHYPNSGSKAVRWASRGPGTLIILTLLLTLLCLPGPARAGQEIRFRVALDDAYRLAISSHEAVSIAGEDVTQARSGLAIATSGMLPNLTAEGAYTKYSTQKTAGSFLVQPDDFRDFALKLTQPVYAGGTLRSARRSARMGLTRSGTAFDFTRQVIMLKTARAYFNALKSQKDLEIKEAALKRTKERKRVALARFRVGAVVKSAVLRAEAETAGAEAERIKARSRLRDSKNLLGRFILGRFAGTGRDIDLVEPAPPRVPSENVEDLIRTALASRLDFKESLIDKAIAGESINRAKGNFLPRLTLGGRYAWKDQEPKTTFFQRETVSASLTLTYPIFEGGLRKAELSGARSELREAEFRTLGFRRDIEFEVRAAYNNLEAANAVIRSYKKQLSFAKEDYKMVFEQFKFGLATTVDVIDSDTELISAERSLMNGTYDLQLAIIELKHSVGLLLEDYVE